MKNSSYLGHLKIKIPNKYKKIIKDVLDTYFEVHMAWQNKQFEWNDPWPILDERLKGIRTRFIMIPQSHTTKKGNQPQAPVVGRTCSPTTSV